MTYYKQLPIDKLKRLAACIVVAGGKLNSAMIGGVEMVLCTKGGCVRVDETSTKELERQAHAKVQTIGELIMSENP